MKSSGFGVEAGLPRPPTLAGDVGPRLLKSEQRFLSAAPRATDRHPARGQFVLQPVQRQARALVDPLDDEDTVRLQNACDGRPIFPAPLSRSRDIVATISPPTKPLRRSAMQPSGCSHPQQHAHEDHSIGLVPSDAGFRPARILNHKPKPKGIPPRFNRAMNRSS
jgi:hypothetical protein